MSKKEIITFKKVSPIRSFGDQAVLSAQIEKYPEIEEVTIRTDIDAHLVGEYIRCAHPQLDFRIEPSGEDTGVVGLDGDHMDGADLATEEGFLMALEHYYGGSSDFDFSKPDEAIYFVEGRVIKYFKDPKIVQNRVERARLLAGLVPQIDFVGENFYSYEFVPGKTIYESVVPGMTTDFLNWCSTKLWNPNEIDLDDLQKADFESKCLDFYRVKTLKRVNLYWQNCGHEDTPTIVNGVATPKLAELLSMVDWQWLSRGTPSRFHGDLHFDNSIYNMEKNDFLLLDWRHEFSGMTRYGDMYYDLAKFKGGLITPYNAIKKNKFEYNQIDDIVTLGIEMPENLDVANQEFEAFVSAHQFDMERISLITGLIFINMSPLHTRPFDLYLHQLGKLMLTKHFEKYHDKNQ